MILFLKNVLEMGYIDCIIMAKIIIKKILEQEIEIIIKEFINPHI